MEILADEHSEKTNPIKANRQPTAGNLMENLNYQTNLVSYRKSSSAAQLSRYE
jgi:hypothetical protein